MVEPVSLGILGGVAGMVLGRFSKGKQESDTESNDAPFNKIEKIMNFVAVKNTMRPEDLIAKAVNGETMFLNIKQLFLKPSSLEGFLYELNMNARKKGLILRQLSSELLLLVDKSHTMNKGVLTTNLRGVNRAPSIIAELNSIMAG